MNLPLLIFWGAIGWSITALIQAITTKSSLTNSWLLGRVVGVVGGILGGWLFTLAWSSQIPIDGVGAAATLVGAIAGAIVLTDLFSQVLLGPQPEPPD